MPKYDFALIFDMDGVIVNNTQFHKKAWKAFCKKHKITLSENLLLRKVYGRTNSEALKNIFGDLTNNKIRQYGEEKEQFYRKIYSNHIKPAKGLLNFIKHLKSNKIKFAIATSAYPKNIRFVLSKTRLKPYFKISTDDTHIKNSKPHPEIYLKTAKKQQETQA